MIRAAAVLLLLVLLAACTSASPGSPITPDSCAARCERDLNICLDSRSQGGFGNVGERDTGACRDLFEDCQRRCRT